MYARCTCPELYYAGSAGPCAACKEYARIHRHSGGWKREPRPPDTREDVLAAMAPWIAREGRLPTSADWRQRPPEQGPPPVGMWTLQSVFGSLFGFQEAAFDAGLCTLEQFKVAVAVRTRRVYRRRRAVQEVA